MAAPSAEVVQTRQCRKFSVGEYYAMADAGILRLDERVELLDGDVVAMTAVSSRHAACIDWFSRTLILALVEATIVRVQGPVRLDDDNEPEPDVVLLRRRDDYYATGHPGPDDVLLLIEVADSTLEFDRNVKLRLYAQAGIPEVWISNLRNRRVESYTDPTEDGYATVRYFEAGSSVTPLNFPDIALEVERIIPA